MFKYWMVHCVKDGYTPSACHDTFQSAEDEAKRLAVKEGRLFVVLEAINSYGVQKPVIDMSRLIVDPDKGMV